MRQGKLALLVGTLLGGIAMSGAEAAEAIKIGIVKTTASGGLFVAQEKGYFAAENLAVEIVGFDAAQIATQATMAGDVDIGATALSAAFYNLAAKGGLKLIGGLAREVPGFHGTAFLATNRAWDAGLTALKGLEHHSIAVPQIGGPLHYEVALIAEKYGLDIRTMRLLPLQTVPNVATAIIGGQPDAGLVPSTQAVQMTDRGQAHLLGWVGDETPWQISAIFVATKNAATRRPMIEAFLRGYRKGARDYYDAVAGPGGKRQDGPTAPAILSIVAKNLDQTPAQVSLAAGYVDPDAKLDVKDVLHQVAWFKAQGMIPADANGPDMIDKRYVAPLAGG